MPFCEAFFVIYNDFYKNYLVFVEKIPQIFVAIDKAL